MKRRLRFFSSYRTAGLYLAAAIGILVAGQAPAKEPLTLPLWPGGAPGAVGESNEDIPTITAWLPASGGAPAPAIVICPGGGYSDLAMGHEGRQVAAWLNEQGIAGIVLKYRLTTRYRHPAPFEDGKRAIRLVRSRASDWNLDAEKIGVMGFSAGGHLASMLGTQFDEGGLDAKDPVEGMRTRPDFMVLCYPFISFVSPETRKAAQAYLGGRLLGREKTDQTMKELSSELHVTTETPPAFIVHAEDDGVVWLEHSLLFHRALRKNEIPAELHTIETGGHGFGLALKDPKLSVWTTSLSRWLDRRCGIQ